MNQEILPIGSIVLLKEGKKKLMIYGRKQRMKTSGQIFDYLGCPYPEGYINPTYSFVFNHEQVVEVIFRGYENEEETRFVDQVLSKVVEGIPLSQTKQKESTVSDSSSPSITDWK